MIENSPETETGRNIGVRISNVGRRAIWAVPITAIATITPAALQLEITPDAWQKPTTVVPMPSASVKTITPRFP